MKQNIGIFIGLLLNFTSLISLVAQELPYRNTVYLPYYRLPRLEEEELNSSSRSVFEIFNLENYDPEPFLPQKSPHSLPRTSKFQEYLISALATGRITQINYFRLLPGKKGDGNLDLSGFYPEHLEYLRKLRNIYGFRLAVCLAGGSSRFSPVMRKRTLREKLGRNVIAIANKWGLDAVDFDWEYPRNKVDMLRYITLIEQVRKGIQAEGKSRQVSVAISRKQPALNAKLFSNGGYGEFYGL